MLTEIYIEALLVDEKLADQVWQAWINGEVDSYFVFHICLRVQRGRQSLSKRCEDGRGAGISISRKAETRAANAGTSHSTITGTIMLLTSSVRSGSGHPPTVGSNRYKSTVISG